MIHITVMLADTLIIATYKDDGWIGTAADAMTGKRYDFAMLSHEMAAVLAVAIDGENDSFGSGTQIELQAIAECAVRDWPKECRPIP